MLASGDAALAAGDFRDAAMRFGRVVGFDDPAVTAAALVGLGEARYRLDDEGAALRLLGGGRGARRDAVDVCRVAQPRGLPGPRR